MRFRNTERRHAMRAYLFTILAALPLLAACTQSVERAEQDVRDARQQAAQDIREEQKDVEDAARTADDRIAREQRDVEDAARAGRDQIIEEQRDVEDARKAEAKRLESPPRR
jgi:hypothetical protein